MHYCQRDQGDCSDLDWDDKGFLNSFEEYTALARLAVSKVGHGKPIKVIKSMIEGVVTEVITAFTVHSKMPLS